MTLHNSIREVTSSTADRDTNSGFFWGGEGVNISQSGKMPGCYFRHKLPQIPSASFTVRYTWGFQVLRYPNFFPSGMEADRNVKVIGGDVAVL